MEQSPTCAYDEFRVDTSPLNDGSQIILRINGHAISLPTYRSSDDDHTVKTKLDSIKFDAENGGVLIKYVVVERT
jgi:hypothetical protein